MAELVDSVLSNVWTSTPTSMSDDENEYELKRSFTAVRLTRGEVGGGERGGETGGGGGGGGACG